MPYHQALSSPKSNLDTNSPNQPSFVSAKVAKLLNKPLMKVSLTASLVIATIYQPTSKQVAYAIDLDKQLKVNSTKINPQSPFFAQETTSTEISEQNSTPFLPRILNVITSRLKNISAIELVKPQSLDIIPNQNNKTSQHNLNLSHGSSYPQANFYLATNTQIKPTLSSSPTESQTQPQLKIHTVKPGDTLSRIASRYQVSREEITKLNNIENSNIIFIAQQLKIPVVQSETELNPAAIAQVSEVQLTSFESLDKPAKDNTSNVENIKTSSSDAAEDPYIAKLRAEIEQMRAQYRNQRQGGSTEVSTTPSLTLNDNSQAVDPTPVNNSPYNLEPNSLQEQTVALKLPPLPPSEEYLPNAFDGYIWPAQGALTSGYGYRWGRLHAGIDIAAPVGTPIFAAASGEVIEAGWNSGGYGNLVRLQHLDGSVTLYAHNERILVSMGQKVNQGEQIAEMGSTGYSTGSHLHFEIHPLGQAAVNPIAYLSK